MNKRYSFRAWHEVAEEMLDNNMQGFEGDVFNWLHQKQHIEIIQLTGLHDKNGKEICEGDLLNIFYTSYNGENNHDCIYQVNLDIVQGLSLRFVGLLWESYGHNQFAINTTLSMCNNSLSFDFENQHRDRLATNPSTSNSLDYSNNIEIIGNIYQNKELLKQ